MHSALGYISPIQFEQQSHRTTQAIASRPGGENKTGYGKAGKQNTLSNFPTATTTTNYNQLWDTVNLATWLGPLRRFVLAHPLGR
jgi:hypothetical protein